jgi:hypothetical protein
MTAVLPPRTVERVRPWRGAKADFLAGVVHSWNLSDFFMFMYRNIGSKIFLGGLTWDITEGALLCMMILGSSDNVPS